MKFKYWLIGIRNWLIELLAGKDTIVLNLKYDSGEFYFVGNSLAAYSEIRGFAVVGLPKSHHHMFYDGSKKGSRCEVHHSSFEGVRIVSNEFLVKK
jgi:hypothetical protein